MPVKPSKTSLVLTAILFLLLGCAGKKTVEVASVEPAAPAPEPKVPATTNLQKIKDRAYQEYLRGNFVGAIQNLEVFLSLVEDLEETWVKNILYYCYMAVGRYGEALTIASDLVRKQPYEYLSYQQVGLAELWLNKNKGALKNFKRALEFEDHQPQVNFFQALAYKRLGDTENMTKSLELAEKEYLEILVTNPKDFNANYELAKLYIFWEKSFDRVPALVAAAYSALDTRQADEDVLKEEQLYRDFHLPLLEGMHLFHTESYEPSMDRLLSALSAAPTGIQADLSEIYFYLGRNFDKLSKDKKAIAFYEKAVNTDPNGMYRLAAKESIRNIASKR